MATAGRLEKAKLILLRPSSAGGSGQEGEISFQFNPKEYTVQKAATWERKRSRGAPQTAMPEFTGAEPATMSLEIFLDATERAGDVSTDVQTLFSCCTPKAETIGRNKPSPPFVVFQWGTKTSFTAYVKSVNAKYTLFKEDGTPIRATCSVTLEEIPNDPARTNPTSGGPPGRRARTMISGESLQWIAYQEYGDPGHWRTIAETNNIDDPLRVRPGMRLLLPPVETIGRPV